MVILMIIWILLGCWLLDRVIDSFRENMPMFNKVCCCLIIVLGGGIFVLEEILEMLLGFFVGEEEDDES